VNNPWDPVFKCLKNFGNGLPHQPGFANETGCRTDSYLWEDTSQGHYRHLLESFFCGSLTCEISVGCGMAGQ